jgi:hypothetical protein
MIMTATQPALSNTRAWQCIEAPAGAGTPLCTILSYAKIVFHAAGKISKRVLSNEITFLELTKQPGLP